MCRKCRELDPAMDAGDRWGWTFHDTTTGKSVSVRYPPMTDRYLVFANRVLSYVRETFPKAELTFYAYNAIEAPPSAVRPAEGLVCGSTAGDYKNPWELTQGVRSAIEWSHFCPVVWRPNILWAFRQSAAPQNFAKALGRDIEMIKRNGLIGAHFDCMGNEWSQKGLAYYMVAKTLLNPDRLSPEDIVDDYCTAGFGPAAGSVKVYFEELEREFVAAVWAFSKGKDEDMRFFPVQKMSEALDEKRLGGFLDQAEKEAAGDAALLGRIRFLRVSYSYAVQEKLMTALRMSGDEARLRNELKKYVGMIVRNIDEHPFAFEPLTVYRGGPFLRWYESAKGK